MGSSLCQKWGTCSLYGKLMATKQLTNCNSYYPLWTEASGEIWQNFIASGKHLCSIVTDKPELPSCDSCMTSIKQ
ncbi:hypothetical protein XELAEV_18024561mg [Xenopus laevis]|uniref:Uncharacterized protein n=1 Tax=Xenopus laevis TaxID=8355 RepID=A0A974HL14_XENLA|nr:hypothetical protein XELAEV_18024561mg [Xenopus laevis]